MLSLPPEYRNLDIRPPVSEDYHHQRFVLKDGKLFPLLAPKGYALYNCSKRNILAIGSKKCLAKDELIFTPDGLAPIGATTVGSLVSGFAGNASPTAAVCGVHPRAELDAAKVTLANGKTIVCSSDHEWWCAFTDNLGNPWFGFLTADKIRERLASGHQVHFPFCSPSLSDDCEFASISIAEDLFGATTLVLDERLSYFLGAMLGDGGCQTRVKGKHRALTFTNIDPECLALVRSVAESLGATLVNMGGCDNRFTHDKTVRLLLEKLSMNSVCGMKDIPAAVQASHRTLKWFLRGLFDTDGTALANGSVGFTSKSERLARTVQDCLARFGIFSALTSKLVRCNGKLCGPYWSLAIHGEHARRFFDVIGFSISRKQARKNSALPTRRVKFGYPESLCRHIATRRKAVFGGRWPKPGSAPSRSRDWHKESGILHCNHYVPAPMTLAKVIEHLGDDDVFRAFRITDTWVPVESISGAVAQLIDVSVPGTDSYFAGGYPSHNCGKTLAVCNRFLRHVWEVDGSVSAVICKTQNNAKIGSWRDLTRIVLPGWVERGFGFEVLEHKHDPSSKMEFFHIRNMHGGMSEIQLHSLHNEVEVEDKFRSGRFSCIWLAEADLFERRETYDAIEVQLRMPHLTYDKYLFLFDCNPPEQGEDHWLIRKFWDECNPESELYVEGLQDKMARFEFTLDDNPFLPQEEKDGVKRTYANNPIAYARFVEGRVVKDVTEGHFAGFFVENIHVVGDAKAANPKDWETLVPSKTTDLLVGLDTGDMNHAATLICPRMTDKAEIAYDVFDELISVGSPISLKTYFKKLVARMVFWNQWLKEAHKLSTLPRWKIWPDSSLWNFRANADCADLDMLVAALRDSGVANYQIQPVVTRDQKAKGEVAKRIALVKRMLHDNRLFISAHCKQTINAIRFLRPAKHGRRIGQLVKPGIPERHPFDSLTYPLSGETQFEHTGQAEPPRSTGIYFC